MRNRSVLSPWEVRIPSFPSSAILFILGKLRKNLPKCREEKQLLVWKEWESAPVTFQGKAAQGSKRGWDHRERGIEGRWEKIQIMALRERSGREGWRSGRAEKAGYRAGKAG